MLAGFAYLRDVFVILFIIVVIVFVVLVSLLYLVSDAWWKPICGINDWYIKQTKTAWSQKLRVGACICRNKADGWAACLASRRRHRRRCVG